jgi:hypothetical protein
MQPTRGSKEASSLSQSTRERVLKFCPCLALLQMGVTWPWHCCHRRWSLTRAAFYRCPGIRREPYASPFHPYPFRGGLSLWPDPVDFSTPGVTRHLALWSADFPRPGKARPRSSNQPEGLYHTLKICHCQTSLVVAGFSCTGYNSGVTRGWPVPIHKKSFLRGISICENPLLLEIGK